MIHFVGLDVHRKQIRACILDGSGRIVHEQNIETTKEAIEAFARERLTSSDRVALEATFNSWSIARLLEPFVGRMVVSNPLQTRAIAQAKIKTDKIDARVLAHLLRCDYLPTVWMPDEGTRLLRVLTHRRASLVAERTRLKNRIHAVLGQALIPLPDGGLFTAKGLRWLAALPLEPVQRDLVDSDLRLMQSAEAEMERLEKELIARAHNNPEVKRLMTLPGLDFAGAQTLLAALGDIARFKSAEQAASYLGLVPSVHQSGGHCYRGPITRWGNGKARWMLIQAAQHMDRNPGPLGVFFRRLARKKNRNVAVVATARKLVVIAWHMLRDGEPYRYAQPEPTRNKLARLRIKATSVERRGPSRKGCARPDNYGTGISVRKVPSLKQLCEWEEIPAPTPLEELKPGERKGLKAMGVEPFVRSLQTEQLKPRHRALKKDRQADSAAMAGGQTRLSGRACLMEEPPAQPAGQVIETSAQTIKRQAVEGKPCRI